MKLQNLKFQSSQLKSPLFSILCGLALLSLAAAEPAQKKSSMPGVPEPQSGGQQGSLPEVIIKGGERSSVGSERPPIELQLDSDEAALPATEVEADLLGRQPEALRNPRAGFAEHLSNANAVLPARIRLARDPVKVFYPLREIMAVSPSLSQEIGTGWEMVITDSEGHSLRKLAGRGLPPANVPWNGRSERGEIISVGKSYSMVITYRDTRGQTRNYVGEPFSFDGVIHQEGKGLFISLWITAIYESAKGTGGEGETIGNSGMELLREAADWIKRYYFTYPIRVECYSRSEALATSRAQGIAKTLGSLLLLPRGEIAASGTITDSVNERIDILIANR